MTTSTQRQNRRGTRTQCDAMTPVAGEVLVDTTKSRTRVGDGVRAGGWDQPNFLDIQYQNFTAADGAGTADAITVTLDRTPGAWTKYLNGMFLAAGTNTVTNPTFGVTGLTGVKTIKKKSSSGKSALAVGDIQTGVLYRWAYDGTDVQIDSVDIQPAQGIQKLKQLTAAASTSLDFTSAIVAGYSEFFLEVEDLTFSVDGAGLQLLTSTDNGATWDTAAGNYGYFLNYQQLNGSNVGTVNSTSDTKISLTNTGSGNTIFAVGNAAAEGLSCRISARGLLGTARKKIFSIDSIELQNSNTADFAASGWAARFSTAAVNALRLKPTSGNLAAGRGTLYGIAA